MTEGKTFGEKTDGFQDVYTIAYDKKHKLNVAPDKVIGDDIVKKVTTSGITIEEVEFLQEEGYPVFSYLTQITIHGIVEQDLRVRLGSDQWVFTNKNKSLGVKWDCIDISKRNFIRKAFKHLSSDVKGRDEYYIFREKKEDMQEIMRNIRFDLLKSGTHEVRYVSEQLRAWTGYPVGYYLFFYVNSIYQKNILQFLNVLLDKQYNSLEEIEVEIKEKEAAIEAKREAENKAWEEKKKREQEELQKEIENIDWHEYIKELGYQKVNALNEDDYKEYSAVVFQNDKLTTVRVMGRYQSGYKTLRFKRSYDWDLEYFQKAVKNNATPRDDLDYYNQEKRHRKNVKDINDLLSWSSVECIYIKEHSLKKKAKQSKKKTTTKNSKKTVSSIKVGDKFRHNTRRNIVKVQKVQEEAYYNDKHTVIYTTDGNYADKYFKNHFSKVEK